MRVGEALKYLKKGDETEKRRADAKILKRGVKLGQGVGALKKGGLEPPYELGGGGESENVKKGVEVWYDTFLI